VVVIVTSMAVAFGVGVGMGPQPGQFAASSLPSVHSVEMAPSSSIPRDDLHEPAGQVRNRQDTVRVLDRSVGVRYRYSYRYCTACSIYSIRYSSTFIF
jgi:hypothetical protein